LLFVLKTSKIISVNHETKMLMIRIQFNTSARAGLAILLAAVLAGCDRNDVKVYEVPKESAAPPNVSAMPWTVPAGWVEEPLTAMVLAKFSGAMVFYLLMWSPLIACIFIVRHFSNDPTALDLGTLGSTFLGITLIGALYMSLGCFASSLTRSQIVAAMIALALGVSLFLLSFLSYALGDQTGWLVKLSAHVSLMEHMRDFSRGVVDVRPLVFYLSLTTVFLFLTLKSVESRRWKS